MMTCQRQNTTYILIVRLILTQDDLKPLARGDRVKSHWEQEKTRRCWQLYPCKTHLGKANKKEAERKKGEGHRVVMQIMRLAVGTSTYPKNHTH